MASKIGSIKKAKKFGSLRRRDGDCCHYCYIRLDFNNPAQLPLNDDNATLDHIVPQVDGGTNENTNLVLACNKCNNYRGGDSDNNCYCLICEKAFEIFNLRGLTFGN